jgi:hypothetical protein
VFNSLPLPWFPGEPMPGQRLSIYLRSVSLPAKETGGHFHVNGITVNKTTQSVESAAIRGACRIANMYYFFPLALCQA